MVHADTGRVVGTPYKTDRHQIGILFGEDGLGGRVFRVVRIYRDGGGADDGVSVLSKRKAALGQRRRWTFPTLQAVREYVDANHAEILNDFARI